MERRLRLVLGTRLFACGMLKGASASRRLKDILVEFYLFASAAMGRRLRLVLVTRPFACGMLKRASASRRLKDINESVTSVCFSSDGNKIASGSWDNTVHVEC